ncbi:MAG TPA: superoxide dismutase family protein [Gemmatimonadaceae bacterium]|jgi:Cu-Zn family superoxide dismutase|nr:superoxide dismutase family protein [Gemmatimonadaceae bacterium]
MKFLHKQVAFIVIVTIAVCGACASASRMGNAVSRATAIIYDINGAPIGTANLWQDPSGVVNVEIASLALPVGTHGIHFHEVGKCDGGATAFSTAGAHYNPLAKQHGLSNPLGPHAGDAPNIVVPAGGVAHVAFTTDRVTLTPGTISLFDADGSSIVVHANADDQVSQPSGNSGPRIACGVVRALP